MLNKHPKRRVFYSFHYEADAWRAAQVRNIGVTEHNEPVSDNDWEQIRNSGAAAIQNWIDQQIAARSCVIVLVGAHTAARKWVQYEIIKAWKEGKGLLGIRIDRLRDQRGKSSTEGPNPFDLIKKENGQPLSRDITLYKPPWYTTGSQETYGYIANNLEAWVEQALNERNRR